MNELTTEKTMTVRAVAEALGVSTDTIKNCIRRIMPNKMANGKTTYLNEVEVATISKELKSNDKVIEQLTYEAGSQVKNTTTEKTMTTKELAEALGVDKSTISRTLESLPDLVATLQQVNINGKTGFVYNEAQATAIKTALQNKTKIAKNGFNTLTISNDFEMLVMQQKLTEYQSRRIAELQAENERKERQLIEQKPKVDFYDRVTESPDCIDIGQCAKILNVKNIGRNKLFEILRQKKILNEHNQPYQKYVDCGYFRIIETSFNLPDGTQKINLKTVVFQRGVDFIRKMIEVAK